MTMVRSFRKSPVKYALLFVFISGFRAVVAQDSPKVVDLSIPSKYEVGQHSTISCSVFPENATVNWLHNGEPLKITNRITQKNETRTYEKDNDGNVVKYLVTNITISNTTVKDSGDYTCATVWGERIAKRNIVLDLSFIGKLLKKTEGPIKLNATDQANLTLECVFEVFNTSDVKWWKKGKDEDIVDLETKPTKHLNARELQSTFDLRIRRTEDNGTYICQTYDPVTDKNISGTIDVSVYAAPKVIIDKVKAISASQLFLNWTVYSHNSPIKSYNLMYRKLPSSDYSLYIEKIGKKNTSIVMEGLTNSTEYQLKLEVTTAYGSSHMFSQTVRTLDRDPIFVPNISIKGFSATSVTIGWAPPPDDIVEFIHYYLLEARKKDESAPKRAYHSRDSRNLPYMFDDLEPHSTYVFRVCACSEFTLKCGDWSEEMEAVTLDGTPGRPSDVAVQCYQDGTKHFLNLTWQQPVKPNAEIKGYTMELTSNVTYKNQFGVVKFETWGPLSKFVTNGSRSVLFDNLKPNTNYTVRLSAMTRTRRRGEETGASCRTPQAPPPPLHKPLCNKILDNNRYMFRLLMQRASERNGPICCYRVYLVRLPPNTDWNLLPPPKDIQIVDYEKAHMETPILGAYITDVFSNDKFPSQSELILGDQNSLKLDTKDIRAECLRCLKKPKRVVQEVVTPPKPTMTSTTTSKDEYFDDDTTGVPVPPEVEEKRERRSYPEIEKLEFFDKEGDYSRNPMLMDKPGLEDDDNSLLNVTDGFLDPQSNYTIFIELIPGRAVEEPIFSEYSTPMQPAPSPPHSHAPTTTEIALQITCAIAALVLLGMIVFCVVQSRRSRKLPPRPHVEMNPIQAALRYVVYHMGGRQQLVTSAPPDLPAIPKDQLAAAYAERQADSDYGFQKEFEMLPECYPDRTTHASEARENQPKNRYPDIKAYDQTRVKLSQIDGIVGSDYINANYVMGYKERKQFICAQGPTDTTVNDFWRMIWEHGLELIVMLTNLEEYSKVKCSKYWPDELRGSKAFGSITVTHVSEKRYSDYIIRELKITRQQTNSEGQPIVDNNGVSKRNGDCNNSESSSAPTSPRENKETTSSTRTVKQYHFLMWKDFAAPEHPTSILKFIKRVNEARLGLVSRAVVVHCSAGVGRSGTLVALDVLLEQCRAEGCVAVFNAVRDLRRHRNFLVQSLKQYVFVYRALVEYAHYGDTEISCSRMKQSIDRLRNTPEGADKCLMELEFEKLMTSPLPESVKSCAAGAGEELRSRNRSQDCLPYDRNRVILTPVPTRDFSTYINASFIEAYDNSEGFIITQDPLPNTIADFWRMVSEHNVSTIIMLSGLGEGKCPRYWDDGSAQFDGITVDYEDSESCPYYTRRQFRVTHNKSGQVSSVKQLQYQGWPTAAGHVPEVTRGLAELADAADLAHPASEPILLHCQFGTERSALFVALCILICQVRVERRVDVCSVARKVRDQRAHTIDTFLQYEFLHRAILNYAELHNLLEDS